MICLVKTMSKTLFLKYLAVILLITQYSSNWSAAIPRLHPSNGHIFLLGIRGIIINIVRNITSWGGRALTLYILPVYFWIEELYSVLDACQHGRLRFPMERAGWQHPVTWMFSIHTIGSYPEIGSSRRTGITICCLTMLLSWRGATRSISEARSSPRTRICWTVSSSPV